ncbi:MG2 domain protein [compost metagenome]
MVGNQFNVSFKRSLVYCALLLCAPVVGRAQEKVQPVGIAPKTVQWFFEKTYLHTDREFYSAGEDLWFNAYLVNGRSANLTATSNNLYVELISPTAEIIDRKVIRLDKGLGKGDFKIKDSIPGGSYQLRAYTNWMRNFNDLFIFQKKIYISSPLSKKKSLVAATAQESIQLFPEGGSLVQGVNGVVAFKALDQQGNGIRVSGKVIAGNGAEIGGFESTDLGLGIFTIKPEAGVKYRVEGSYANGKKFSTAIPDALSKGISLHVLTDSANIKAVISVNEAMLNELKNKDLIVSVKHGGSILYTEQIKLAKAQVSMLFPLQGMPQGITSITILDDQGRPNCERLIYVPGKPVILSVLSDKVSYKSQEQVNLTVKVVDGEGKPVKANLSLAAVDAIVPGNESNIASYLWLESEIKGNIQDPARYFDEKNSGRSKQLDLLLMTQGWRNYLWKKLADAKPVMSYMPEPGITISGKVRQKVGSKVLPDMNITLFGDGLQDSKIYMTKSMADGRYFLDGLKWFGNQSFKLSSKDAKGKKAGWIMLDSLFNDPLKVNAEAVGLMLPDLSAFDIEAARRMAFNRIAKSNEAIDLKEVVIDGGDKKNVVLRDETLMTFGYPDLIYNITAADYDYKSLEHFLLTKVPGAISLSDTTEGVAFMASGGARVAPRIVVNKQEDIFGRLDYYSLPMNQVNKITVRHLIRNGGGDAYVINLDLKEEALRGSSLDILNTTLPGYYQAREFYNPSFQDKTGAKQDLRTTIFWAPLLSTNEQGEAKLSFLNADPKATISIRAEGITTNGVPIAGGTQYQVK